MVNYLIVLFAVTLVYISSTERFRIYASILAIQGLLLCGIALFELQEVDTINLVFVVFETLIIKTIVIPALLRRIIKRSGVYKVHHLAMPGFYSIILAIVALLASILLANALINPHIDAVFMTVALFALLTGLLLIVTHKLILSHFIGFLIIENSVFLFSMAIGNKMPMLLNVGITLDIFVGILMLGFFGLRLNPHSTELNKLKD